MTCGDKETIPPLQAIVKKSGREVDTMRAVLSRLLASVAEYSAALAAETMQVLWRAYSGSGTDFLRARDSCDPFPCVARTLRLKQRESSFRARYTIGMEHAFRRLDDTGQRDECCPYTKAIDWNATLILSFPTGPSGLQGTRVGVRAGGQDVHPVPVRPCCVCSDARPHTADVSTLVSHVRRPL